MKLRALDPLLYPIDEDIIQTESSFIEHFYQLITRSIQPPYVISIDGLWGTGKTTVMKILQDKLKKSGFPVSWKTVMGIAVGKALGRKRCQARMAKSSALFIPGL